jgi:hypothetical protein
MRRLRAYLAGSACALLALPGAAAASAGGVSAAPARPGALATAGGTAAGPLPAAPQAAPTAAPAGAARLIAGVAHAPHGAPIAVRRLIAAGNLLQHSRYRYGGGHASFRDSAYDCSGTVSFALHGGGLLTAPLDSTGLAGWGLAGPGSWLTVYANRGHAFLVVAGLRLDTSGTGGSGPRWRPDTRSTAGFQARHPAGL